MFFVIGFIVLVAIIVTAVWLFRSCRLTGEGDSAAAMAAIIASAILGFMTVAIPFERISHHADIAAHKELQATLDRARASDWDGYERATIQRMVAASNSELRRRQTRFFYYWPYIPGTILEVEPVE